MNVYSWAGNVPSALYSEGRCPNCGRLRLGLTVDRKLRCYKCHYIIEEKRVLTDDELEKTYTGTRDGMSAGDSVA